MSFVEPKKIVEQCGLTHGMKVADLGAGSGFYEMELSKAVGENGKVYAVDIQQELLTKIKNRARTEHVSNIEVIWGDLEKIRGTRIQDGSLDCVLASNVLFQIPDKPTFVQEVNRILKKGGRVFIIEWSDSFGGMGPLAEDIVSAATAQKLFENAGFQYDRIITAGDHHYGMILKK